MQVTDTRYIELSVNEAEKGESPINSLGRLGSMLGDASTDVVSVNNLKVLSAKN